MQINKLTMQENHDDFQFLLRSELTPVLKLMLVGCNRGADRCRHYMVEVQTNGKYVILGEDRAHSSLTDLVQCHTELGIKPFMELLTEPCGQVSLFTNYSLANSQQNMTFILLYYVCPSIRRANTSRTMKSSEPLLQLLQWRITVQRRNIRTRVQIKSPYSCRDSSCPRGKTRAARHTNPLC